MSAAVTMRHWYSNEWYEDNELNTSTKAATQEELQEIAGQIRKNCKVEKIGDNGFSMFTQYINENIGVRYWVKDKFGWIDEIDEARSY